MSGDGQRFAAGPAFTLQPHNPALYEQRAEEPVSAAAAAQPRRPLHGKKIYQQDRRAAETPDDWRN